MNMFYKVKSRLCSFLDFCFSMKPLQFDIMVEMGTLCWNMDQKGTLLK